MPLTWCRDFGRRSKHTLEKIAPLICKSPKDDEGYFDYSTHPEYNTVEGVTIVRTKAHAEQVLEKLMAAPPTTFHACDTEVMALGFEKGGTRWKWIRDLFIRLFRTRL